MSDFEDYTNLGQVLERNVTTMYDSRARDDGRLRRLQAESSLSAEDYTNLGQVLERNVTTMYDYLYRYREPNSPGSLPIRAVP